MKRIIVVGGGLAGLITAIRLSRSGHRIILFEKQGYPRHKVCGEYISMEVYDFLCREELMPAGNEIPFITKLSLSSTGGALTTLGLSPGGFGISRYLFEDFLFSKAIEAGVKVLQNEVVDTGRGGGSYVVTLNREKVFADIIIGAHGKRTKLDMALKRKFVLSHSPYVGVKFHADYTEHPADTIALHNFPGGYCGICNVEDGITNICYLVHRDKLRIAGSIENLQESVLFQNPLLREAFSKAQSRFSKPKVINEITFEAKKPFEGGMLMVGDAAGMITPFCGNGMAMAIHSAKLVSDIIINNPAMYTEDVAIHYGRSWKKIFAARLAWGRVIQAALFGKRWASGMAVAIGNKLPGAANYLIEKTHGRSI